MHVFGLRQEENSEITSTDMGKTCNSTQEGHILDSNPVFLVIFHPIVDFLFLSALNMVKVT